MASQPTSGFLIVAFLTERLPVCLIPEQPLISPMRYDMIYDRCRDNLSLCQTESAERMLLQEQSTSFSPFPVISLFCSTSALSITTPHDMILTEYLALVAKPGTPRVAAGPFRLLGHFRTSVQIIKKPRSS